MGEPAQEEGGGVGRTGAGGMDMGMATGQCTPAPPQVPLVATGVVSVPVPVPVPVLHPWPPLPRIPQFRPAGGHSLDQASPGSPCSGAAARSRAPL